MIDPIQKEAIVKLNQHGMTVPMIARVLGLEPSSVRSHLTRNPHQHPQNKVWRMVGGVVGAVTP